MDAMSPKNRLQVLKRMAIEEAERQIARRAENFAKSYFVGRRGRAFMKEAARRAALRYVTFAFAATLVGYFVAWLIMLTQYVLGNLMHKRWMPKLGIVERMVFWVLNGLTFIVVITLFGILAMIVLAYTDPVLSLQLWGTILF